jgi:hypothetical protein
MVIQSALNGQVICTHDPVSVGYLGIKNVNLSPNGSFISSAWFDGKVRLYSNISWQELTSLEHSQMINTKATLVYKEE